MLQYVLEKKNPIFQLDKETFRFMYLLYTSTIASISFLTSLLYKAVVGTLYMRVTVNCRFNQCVRTCYRIGYTVPWFKSSNNKLLLSRYINNRSSFVSYAS